MVHTVIGSLCAGLLSAKGKTSLKSFTKIYVIVYINRIIVDLVLTKPNRKKVWDIEKVNNKAQLITILYEKKQKYITCKYNQAGIQYIGLNKNQMLLLRTILRWAE